jgi:AcrR family transcriptional regulator
MFVTPCGVLYHHFAGKEALFEAVFRELEIELQISAAAPVGALAASPAKPTAAGCLA